MWKFMTSCTIYHGIDIQTSTRDWNHLCRIIDTGSNNIFKIITQTTTSTIVTTF